VGGCAGRLRGVWLLAVQPLNLQRLSPPPQPTPETKSVISIFEDVTNSGDERALGALRASIERRILDLETFYASASGDDRALLFEKQRLKLRKLLHEYDEYAASLAQGEGAGAGAPPATPSGRAAAAETPGGRTPGGAGSTARGSPSGRREAGAGATARVTTRVIREDTRLTLAELTAWFNQAGAEEMV